jgi:hypothetical protein
MPLHPNRGRDLPRGPNLEPVSLAIIDRQGEEPMTSGAGNRRDGG